MALRAAVAVLLIALSGCATGYRKLGWAESGYEEKQIDFNTWMVSYHGSDQEFCKKAARYRAAELCRAQGQTYVSIKSAQTLSSFIGRTRNPVQDPRDNPAYVVENTSGLERKYDQAGYSLRVGFVKARPESGDAYDAALELSQGVPGAEKTANDENRTNHGK